MWRALAIAAVVLGASMCAEAALETDHWRTETYPEQGGFLVMWLVGAIVLAFYTGLFVVFKHSLLTRWHFLLGLDIIFMLVMYVFRFGVYIEAGIGDYSANVFFDFLSLLFQFAVVSDLLFLWLYEYGRYQELTLVRRSSFCMDLVLRPGFSAGVLATVRAILSAGLVAVAVLYSSEETKNQDFISMIYFVAHLLAFVFFGVYPMVVFNVMLSAFSYAKKPRKAARRVLRDVSMSYLYVPFWAVLYFFTIVIWLVISRKKLGQPKTQSGVLSVQVDTHEAMKIPIFTVVVLINFAYRIRDYQELNVLPLFSEYDELDDVSNWSHVDDGSVTKTSRDVYRNFPVEAKDDHDDQYTYDEGSTTDATTTSSAEDDLGLDSDMDTGASTTTTDADDDDDS